MEGYLRAAVDCGGASADIDRMGGLYRLPRPRSPLWLMAHLLSFQGKLYMFDKVIKPNATQEKVYNDAARTIVKGKRTAPRGG